MTKGVYLWALTTLLLFSAVAPPAAADDNTCASVHSFASSATGTVHANDRYDWWDHQSSGVDHRFRLDVRDADADLYVWNEACTELVCFSDNGGTYDEECLATGGHTRYNVEVRYWDCVWTCSATYTLTNEHVGTDPACAASSGAFGQSVVQVDSGTLLALCSLAPGGLGALDGLLNPDVAGIEGVIHA